MHTRIFEPLALDFQKSTVFVMQARGAFRKRRGGFATTVAPRSSAVLSTLPSFKRSSSLSPRSQPPPGGGCSRRQSRAAPAVVPFPHCIIQSSTSSCPFPVPHRTTRNHEKASILLSSTSTSFPHLTFFVACSLLSLHSSRCCYATHTYTHARPRREGAHNPPHALLVRAAAGT